MTDSTIFWDLDPDNSKKKNMCFVIEKFGIPSITCEIGTYQGAMSLWLVEQLGPLSPNLTHFCIDPYDTSVEIEEDLDQVYQFFTHQKNNARYGHLINLLRMRSFEGLIQLWNKNIHPQLIYIDGDHTSSTVLEDLVLSFSLLQPGGVIVCDDSIDWKYQQESKIPASQMSPRMAVEMFIACNWHKLNPLILPYGSQTAFIKL